MKSVKRVLKRSFQPRYNLRSRKTAHTSAISSTPKVPKVDTSVQANLSEEENCELLHELPFCPNIDQVPPPQANIQNSRKSFTEQSRSIPTAYTSPDTANRSNREAIDISIDQNETEASIFQAKSASKQLPRSPHKGTESSSLEDFSPIDSRRLRSGLRIALQVPQISETSDKEPHSPKQGQASADDINNPSINSPALIHKQVTDRINYKKPKQTRKIFRSESISSYEFETSETDGVREEDSEDSDEEKELYKAKPVTKMEKEFLEEQQRLITALTQRLASKDVRIDKYRGYENEDINRWFEKLELQLEAKGIRTADPVAILQVVNNLSGPAETFLFELPSRDREDYASLKQALKRRYSTKDRAWVRRQRLVSRKQGQHEPLSDYINEMHELFSGLEMGETEKVTYFTEGLRHYLKVKVLERMPETLFEAEEIARTVDSISRRVSRSSNEESLEKVVTALLAQSQSKSSTGYPDKPPAWVDSLLEKFASLNNTTDKGHSSVAALTDQQSEGSGSFNRVIKEIQHMEEEIGELRREMDTKLQILAAQESYGNTASLAAFSEAKKTEIPEFREEIRRMENTFRGQLENMYRQVDNRIRGLARRKISRPELTDRERNRQSKPMCYKCGRIGHIQYDCYRNNQPEDLYQNQEVNTHSGLETDQQANAQRPICEVTLAVTNEQRSQILPNHEQSCTRQHRKSKHPVQSSNILLLQKSDANLKSSDLTTEGKIAHQSVQLLVDTGACVSAIDKQFFMKIYGQFPPKMSEGSLSSVQTVSGDTVPVLGKITIPLHLNGREYPCVFHVIQSLAYDAILGRDFLQENKALIDLDNSSITFKAPRYPGKQIASATTVPVMGTFLPQPQNLKEKKTKAPQAEPAPAPNYIESKLVQRRQKNQGLLFPQPLLVLMFIVVYLLTASFTPHIKDSAKPVIQKMPKFFVQRTPDFKIEDGQVIDTSVHQANCKEKDQSVPNEKEAGRINIPKSNDAAETMKSDYSSQITVDQYFVQQEDEKKDVLHALNTQLGNEVPSY